MIMQAQMQRIPLLRRIGEIRVGLAGLIMAAMLGAVAGNALNNIGAVHGTREYFIHKYCPAQVTKALKKRPVIWVPW